MNNRESEGRRATRSVFGLTLIGLLAGSLLLGVEEYLGRHIAESHQSLSDFQERTSSAIETLDTAVNDAQAGLFEILNTESEEVPSQRNVQVARSLQAGREAISSLEAQDSILNGILAEFGALETQVLEWRADWEQGEEAFTATQAMLRTRLTELESRVDAFQASERLDIELDLARFHRQRGEAAHQHALMFTRKAAEAVDLQGLRDELTELALLTQQLMTEQDIDFLNHMKDNRLGPNLARIRHHISELESSGAAESGLTVDPVDKFSTALFGENFERDERRQTITLGSEGFFGSLTSLLGYDRALSTLLTRITDLQGSYGDARANLVQSTEAQSIAVSESIDEAIRSARIRTLPVIVLAVIAFLGLARLVARALRKQMLDLESSHNETAGALAELRLTQQAIPSILIRFDLKHRIVGWNRHAQETLEMNQNDVLNKRLIDLTPRWDVEPITRALMECANNREGVSIDKLPFETSSGRRGTLELRISPRLGDNEELRGMLLIGADIQERIDIEMHLAQSQKLESIGQLAAGIAHEINTPTQYATDNVRFMGDASTDLLKVVDAVTEILGDCDKEVVWTAEQVAALAEKLEQADLQFLSEELPKSIEQCLGGLESVGQIVRAMKEFAHPGETEKSEADLNHTIENALTVARNEWKYRAELDLQLDPDLPLVPCVQGEFNQVVLNLVVNASHAIAYDQDESELKKGLITIATSFDDEWAIISIHDNGCGIPEEIRTRIFDPFFTTKEVGVGSGQGLAIAHSVIVDKHQGSIEVESVEGEGTTFVIRLPLAPQDDHEVECHRDSRAGSSSLLS